MPVEVFRDAVVGAPRSTRLFTNPWVRKLKIGLRAKEEAADDKEGICCITYKAKMTPGWIDPR